MREQEVPTNADQDKLQRADHDALVRVETKIDAFITSQADHEVRLRALEKEGEAFKGSLEGTIKSIRLIGGLIAFLVGVIEPILLFYLSRGH